jgi:hypothetical protein
MELLRYFRKNLKESEDFGEFEFRHSWDFEWYMGKGKIGIYPMPSTEAECFYNGFLSTEDALIIKPYVPEISRKNNPLARIGTSDSGIKNTQDIIELLIAEDSLHAYISSIDKKCSNILTFSLCAPSDGLYTKAKPMPINLEEKIRY